MKTSPDSATSAHFSMAGKTVLITGGGTGLGLQFAHSLGSAGAHVVIAGRRLAILAQAADALSQSGIRASVVELDASNEESVLLAFQHLESLSPNVLINNAGTSSEAVLRDLEISEWNRVMDTNLRGAWLVGREFVRQLEPSTTGNIVNVASVLGTSVQKGTGAYTSSKAGLIHLTRQMAVEWAKFGVRVNALLPGYYRTDIANEFLETETGKNLLKKVPMRRLGEPADLHGPMLMLASDSSTYMTGSTLTIDGGLAIATV